MEGNKENTNQFDMFCQRILPSFMYKTIRCVTHEGVRVFYFKLLRMMNLKNQYPKWILQNETDLLRVEPLEYNPLISVVVPVYNVKSKLLIDCIESVVNQTYKNWELCLVDDCSTMESVGTVLHSYEGNEKIKITYRKENGHISRATNTGIEMATGEFVALLDCDDLLAPNALYEMAKKLNSNKEYDFIYSDEDKLSPNGKKRKHPFFKPDWSPDTFMSLMYTCHFAMFRKSLLDELGGMRVGLEGSQDYDLVLRVMEKTDKIGHIPKILYHWRERKGSTADKMTAKPYIIEATKKAKLDALERRGLSGRLEYLEDIVMFRIVYDIKENPKVSIIIPSKDNYNILKQCIESVNSVTEYNNYEIIVVDNGSIEENRKLYEKLCEDNGCHYHYEPMEFNFSRMCNIGASIATGEYYLFLNDDIEIQGPQWLTRMLGQAQLSHVGAVGCRLIYPNTNFIQHAGVVNYEIGPGHAFHQTNDDMNCYWGRNKVDYNFVAVTGACLLVSKNKYDEVGGFEEDLPVAYNDVELCFKLVEAGYYNVLRNDVRMLHYESVSRGYDDVNPEKLERQKREMAKLYELHPGFVGYDPCYNPNLSRNKGDFTFNVMNAKRVSLPRVVHLDVKEDNIIEYGIDEIKIDEILFITGWAFIGKKPGNIQVLLQGNNGEQYIVKTYRYYRPEIRNAYGNKKLAFSGLEVAIDIKDLPKGRYSIYFISKENAVKVDSVTL
ncbi:MAG: glycosyltransferase [Lachnospiraceae bacterium]